MKPLLAVISIVVVLLFFAIAGPWLLVYWGLSFQEDPPLPKYTYGEFPFYAKYQVDGKTMTIEDTVIVKYDGVGLSEGTEKFIKWKQTLASGNEEVVLLKDGDSIRIILSVREINYHLEDNVLSEDYGIPVIQKEEKSGKSIISRLASIEDLDKYKLRMIEFKYGEPIRN
ncbi:hypothetical protein [Paenibacillus glycanilyticus]|uniref:DUF4825 domain-containing protein n=1 Tax=Paenibacillus glycanilyticus TaxID=126569 RepID=A0ABQ6G5W8_9BACL|nr:hypothetical protein [Paenibacillus glycanilyticus]GLX65663.1 hypothetical protein MU1_00070 [Paenibacillus glycanilyticus]